MSRPTTHASHLLCPEHRLLLQSHSDSDSHAYNHQPSALINIMLGLDRPISLFCPFNWSDWNACKSEACQSDRLPEQTDR